jgi:hypothetical protein
MVFKPAIADGLDFFHRWVSVGGRWEIGFTQMMFGVRVRMGLVGCGCVDLDYCAGADEEFQQELLRTVMTILIPISEDISPRQLSDTFPRYQIKPINKDPDCWPALQKMAATVLEEYANEKKAG